MNGGDYHVLVDYCLPDLCPFTDSHPGENNAFADQGASSPPGPSGSAPELLSSALGSYASAAYDGIIHQRLTENEFRRRGKVGRRFYGPELVVQVQFWLDAHQVHIGFPIRPYCPHIPPV